MLLIDVLDYVRCYEHINAHADMNSSSLFGFGKCNENKVYLVDFGLACRCSGNGNNEDYKKDPRKAHEGTVSLTSLNGDVGTRLRRRGLEILGVHSESVVLLPTALGGHPQGLRAYHPPEEHAHKKHPSASEPNAFHTGTFHAASQSSSSTWPP
ncbi:hypothetical protein MTO96_033403 [Rhipicephalus appendiculatus]